MSSETFKKCENYVNAYFNLFLKIIMDFFFHNRIFINAYTKRYRKILHTMVCSNIKRIENKTFKLFIVSPNAQQLRNIKFDE